MRIQHHAFLLALATAAFAAKPVPVTWDEAALANWATPVAGLNQRPTHMSAKDYYAWPIDNLRTYPVYYPGREPAGYWEMLERVGPKPLIEPERLKTEADWIEAGRRVFDELDHIPLRTFDPKFITAARTAPSLGCAGRRPPKESRSRIRIAQTVTCSIWGTGRAFLAPRPSRPCPGACRH